MMYKALAYYDYRKLLSFNAPYTICVGGRGLGKTYGAKKKVIKDAIKGFSSESGLLRTFNQFIYLRRYKPELRLAKDTFFSDIEHEFPDYDFRVSGIEAQIAPVSTRDDRKRFWTTMGWFLTLVTAQHYKSVSFHNVKTIIFDEFIIERGAIHYLPNEATILNNFYSTVDRYKDKTKVIMLANSVSITNPYFIEWDINPKDADKNGIVKKYKGFIVCHFPDSKEFNNQAYETVFGQFIKGTDYANYAVENQFADNHDALISEKLSRAIYLYTLEGKEGAFSVWYDSRDDAFFCQEKRPKNETYFTLIPENMTEEKILLMWRDRPLSTLRGSFRRGRVWFDKPATRNAFFEIFKQ